MPEQYKQKPETISKWQGYEPETEEEKKLTKKFLKLAAKITDNVETKLHPTTDCPEFWSMRELLSEDEGGFLPVRLLLTGQGSHYKPGAVAFLWKKYKNQGQGRHRFHAGVPGD